MTFLGWGGGRGKRAQYGRAVLSAPSWEAGSWFHREGQGSGLRRRVAGRAGTPGLPVAGTRGPKRLRARKHHEDQRPPGAGLALAKPPGLPAAGTEGAGLLERPKLRHTTNTFQFTAHTARGDY